MVIHLLHLHSGVPSKYTTTSVGVTIHGLSSEDVERRRSAPFHSTHMRRHDSHFPEHEGTSIEEHAEDVSVSFEWEEGPISLRCRRNDALIPSDYHIVDGDTTVWGTERCYYTCKGNGGLHGTLTTCEQFRGIFVTADNDELLLGPVDEDIQTSTHAEYYVYRRSDSPADQHTDSFCGGVKHEDGTVTGRHDKHAHDHHHHHGAPHHKKPKHGKGDGRRRASTAKPDKFVGLLIGVGPGFIDYHNNRRNAPGAERMALTIMNQVQESYKEDVFNYDIFITINEIQYYRDFEQNCGTRQPLPCNLETFSERRDNRAWNFLRGSGDDMLNQWSSYVERNNAGSGNAQRWDSVHSNTTHHIAVPSLETRALLEVFFRVFRWLFTDMQNSVSNLT